MFSPSPKLQWAATLKSLQMILLLYCLSNKMSMIILSASNKILRPALELGKPGGTWLSSSYRATRYALFQSCGRRWGSSTSSATPRRKARRTQFRMTNKFGVMSSHSCLWPRHGLCREKLIAELEELLPAHSRLSWPSTPRVSTWLTHSRSAWIGFSGISSPCSARLNCGGRRRSPKTPRG